MIPLLVLLFFASFLRLPPPAGAACSPKRCGNLTVAYPFWLEEPGQPSCGSPSFQLRCNGSTKALLVHSMFGMYQVAEIFTENSSFVAVDNNLFFPAAGCPRWWFNVSAGLGLGPYTISRKNRELLVLYNCTERQRSTPQGFLPTLCANESFYQLGGEYAARIPPGGLPAACRLSVVPVLGFRGDDEYVGSMKGGFLLEWTVPSDNCPRCVASGGQCRYLNDGTGFSCNCSGAAVYPDECPGERGSCNGILCFKDQKFSHIPKGYKEELPGFIIFTEPSIVEWWKVKENLGHQGYKANSDVYFIRPRCEPPEGMVLISCQKDVAQMLQALKGTKKCDLYSRHSEI